MLTMLANHIKALPPTQGRPKGADYGLDPLSYPQVLWSLQYSEDLEKEQHNLAPFN
jgi:hypothetical protein